jgi:branched-chain amino acid transport system substrate-binding protein
MGRRRSAVIGTFLLAFHATPAAAQKTSVPLPVLAPLSGFVSIEAASQKNGASLAERTIREVRIESRVLDTQTSTEGAVAVWERAVRRPLPPAVMGPLLGPQMLAVMPLAQSVGVPLLTLSTNPKLSEAGNPYFFRFLPSDAVAKAAHARYVVEKLGAKRPAVIYQATADGQAARDELSKAFTALKTKPVLEESLAHDAVDLAALLARVKAANADAIVLHLRAASSAQAVRQARKALPGLPIVASIAMHQPSTAALLEPAELKGVCAETAASPASATDGPMREFAEAYRKAFKAEPDAFAAAQFDAMQMVTRIATDLAKASQALTPISVRTGLSRDSYKGLITTYKSDGKGNLAHDVQIVCYDGTTRIPVIVERYAAPPR